MFIKLASEKKYDITTAYTYDPTGIVMSNDGTDTVRFIKDPHGNVVATSKNDKIVDSYDYTAFGVQLNSAETSNPFRYCGEYYDEELDSVYLRNRYYQPTTGRFINEDPIKDGLNWYSYCGNNPVMMVDPSGLSVHVDEDGNSLVPAYLDWDGDGRIDTADDRNRFDKNGNGIADWREYFDDEPPTSPNNSRNFAAWYQCRTYKIFDNYPFVYQGYTNLCWAATASGAIEYITGRKIDFNQIDNDKVNYENSKNDGTITVNNKSYTIPSTVELINHEKYLEGSGYETELINRGEFTFEWIQRKINEGMPILLGKDRHVYSIIGYAYDEELNKKYIICYNSNDNPIPISFEITGHEVNSIAYSFKFNQ